MPNISASELETLTSTILTRLGVPAEEAREVASVLVEANLAGHDSHGVIRIPQYAHGIRDGLIHPGAPFDVVHQTAVTAVVNAHMSFGHVAMLRALKLAEQKARASGLASVMIRECNHIGRLGTYALRAAQAGFVCQLGVNSPSGRCVAPWGGIDRRLGTNPLCMGVPSPGEPLVLDMTTSVVAEGKVRVMHHKHEPVPGDWLIDHEGNPTTDPGSFYQSPAGALLPMGGSVGYKGFGLGVMLDLICGAMSGMGAIRPDLPPGPNGVWLTLWRIDAFVPAHQFLDEVGKLSAYIKSSRRRTGVEEILMPGEIEARMTARRLRDGIPIPEETWKQIQAV